MNLFKRHSAPAGLPTFEQVLAQYQQPLYWHVRRMVVDHDDAQDVLQETYVNIYKGMDQLRDPGAIKAWVYRIATRECLRHLQRRRETALSSIDDGTMLLDSLMDSVHVDYDNEMGVKFQQALLTLTHHQRLVFNLRYYDEMTYDEIAELTGSPATSLKVTYHTAREKVKEFMTR